MSPQKGTEEFRGKMHYPGMTTLTFDYCNLSHMKEDYVIMEWSGRDDRFDSHIYEGDVVKSGNEEIWEVCFGEWIKRCGDNDHKMWGWYIKNVIERNFEREECEMYVGQRLEVIGNIYENPELLTNAAPSRQK